MKFSFNPEDLLTNRYLRKAAGEYLRDVFFDQSEGLGCYMSFELREGVEKLPSRYDTENEIETFRLKKDDVIAEYAWDHDGELQFIFSEADKTYILYNSDCKKDYTWRIRTESLAK